MVGQLSFDGACEYCLKENVRKDVYPQKRDTIGVVMKKPNTLFLAQFGVLLAIEALFCFTFLGSLPAIGPIVATLGMIPVIITAVILGVRAGTLMGFFAGLFSFIVWTFMPPPLSAPFAFVFSPFHTFGDFQGNFGSVLICFVPRILVGTVAGLVYKALQKVASEPPHIDILWFSVAAVAGSLTNTFGVLGGIWLFFGAQYASAVSEVTGAAMTILYIVGFTILTSGLPEAAVSAIVCSGVCKPLKIVLGKRKTNNEKRITSGEEQADITVENSEKTEVNADEKKIY